MLPIIPRGFAPLFPAGRSLSAAAAARRQGAAPLGRRLSDAGARRVRRLDAAARPPAALSASARRPRSRDQALGRRSGGRARRGSRRRSWRGRRARVTRQRVPRTSRTRRWWSRFSAMSAAARSSGSSARQAVGRSAVEEMGSSEWLGFLAAAQRGPGRPRKRSPLWTGPRRDSRSRALRRFHTRGRAFVPRRPVRRGDERLAWLMAVKASGAEAAP